MAALLDATNAPASPHASLLHARVKDDNDFRGTVRYVGPVATSKKDPAAVWLGVEWDDATRGKHDGAVVAAGGEEARYFSCPAGAGSFVKPGKVDAGSSLVDALQSKYVKMDAPVEAPGGLFEHRAYTKRGNTKSIEFCGELKVRAEQQLDEGAVDRVVLRCAGVARLGVLDAVATDQLRHLAVLDLQCNLLASWAEAASIVAAAPALTKLDVSGNRLRSLPEDDLSPFDRLQSLAANGVGLTSWADVLRLGRAAPRLTTLHVARNAVCSALDGDAAAAFPELVLLDVAATGLADAAPLAALPRLGELHANENPALAALAGSFPRLEALAVAGCGFEGWAAVDALNAACPRLARMRFGRDNALTASLGASEARALLIARLPTVVHLNGATVSPKERVEAEKRYVRVAAAQIAAGRAAAADHPRLEALKERHGDPNLKGADVKGDGTLAAALATLTLRCVAAEHCHKAPVTKKFPASTKVALLKRIAKKLFKIDGEMVLYHVPEEGAAPTYLDDDGMPISYFGIVDGATVDVADKVLEDD